MDIDAFEEWLYDRLPGSEETRKARVRYLKYIQRLGIEVDTYEKPYKIAKDLFGKKLTVHSHNNAVAAINLFLEFKAANFRLKKIPRKGIVDRYVPSDRVITKLQKVKWPLGYQTRRYQLALKIFTMTGIRNGELVALRKENFGYKEVRTTIDMKSVLIQRVLHQWEQEGTKLTVNDFRTLVAADVDTLAVMLNINRSEINKKPVKNYYVHVLGKNEKERNVPIPEALYKDVQEYMALEGARTSYLFENDRGTHLSTNNLRKAIKYAGRSIGEERLHPHAFRHWRARDLWRKGVDIIVISRFLGHTDIHTTKIYLESITDEERFEEILSRDPFFGLGEVVLKDIFFNDQLARADTHSRFPVFAQNPETAHREA